MAEAAGFEPANHGVKVRCVTASPCLHRKPTRSGLYSGLGEKGWIVRDSHTFRRAMVFRPALNHKGSLLEKYAKHGEDRYVTKLCDSMESATGFGPALSAWKADVLTADTIPTKGTPFL